MNFTEQITASPSGGTISLAGDPLPTTGYFVGGMVSPLILDEGEVQTHEGRAKIDEFIAYLNGPTVGAPFLGWWTDEETGKLWVDGTSHYLTEFIASRIGRRRNEIAIFDIERQQELRLTYTEGE